MKYAWIKHHRDQFTIAAMCRVLKVSRSGFYGSLKERNSEKAIRSKRIRAQIAEVHASSNGIYGSYKVAKQMQQNNTMESACRNTVARAMQEMGLKSRTSKRFRPKTTKVDQSKQPAENILKRIFTAEAPNKKWVTDITYLPVANGWVYLACVMDLFSRKIVGWEISNSLATPLVSAALRTQLKLDDPTHISSCITAIADVSTPVTFTRKHFR